MRVESVHMHVHHCAVLPYIAYVNKYRQMNERIHGWIHLSFVKKKAKTKCTMYMYNCIYVHNNLYMHHIPCVFDAQAHTSFIYIIFYIWQSQSYWVTKRLVLLFLLSKYSVCIHSPKLKCICFGMDISCSRGFTRTFKLLTCTLYIS